MIIGIGNDLVEIERVKRACEKEAFLTRCFTEKEIELFGKKPSSLAGNFAVKESVAKAFGTGFRKFEAGQIEVLRDELGKPYVNLYGDAKDMYDTLKGKSIHVTITNTKELASAVVILEG